MASAPIRRQAQRRASARRARFSVFPDGDGARSAVVGAIEQVRARLSPLGSPAFRAVWFSSLASSGAQWMERTVTGWVALELSNDPYIVGIVFSLRMLPFLVFGLVAGAAADRYPRRRVVMAAAGTAALIAGGLALAAWRGSLDINTLIVLSIASGAMFVFDTPARGALLVDIVGRGAAPSAIALNGVALRFFGAVGAFAGGGVVYAMGVPTAYAIVALVHLLALAIIASARLPSSGIVRTGTQSLVASMTGAAAMIARYPAVRMVVIVSIAAEIFGYSYQAIVPTVARDILGQDARGLGALLASASVGSTLAVVAITFLPPGLRRQPLVAATLIIWGAGSIALGISSAFAVSMAVMFVIGACASSIDALQQTLAQLAVPEEERGRAVGVWVFSIGMNVVGLYQVGLVASVFDPRFALVANGLLGITCVFVLMLFATGFRLNRLGVDRAAPAVGSRPV
jgi:MFS family permease